MGYNSSISGLIEGISADSFELIKEDHEDVFQEVSWHNNTVEISSYGKHYDDIMSPVYDKLAFCMEDGGRGCLDEEGEDCGDLSTIFFVPRQWKRLWAKVIYPSDPFIKNEVSNGMN